MGSSALCGSVVLDYLVGEYRKEFCSCYLNMTTNRPLRLRLRLRLHLLPHHAKQTLLRTYLTTYLPLLLPYLIIIPHRYAPKNVENHQ